MITRTRSSIPVIGVCHTYSFEQIKNCDYIISVNKDMRDCLLNLGYNPNKIFHIPNMIRLPENLSYNRPALQQSLIIGLIGRIEKAKGVDIFVKAISLLKQKNVQLKALIAGDGPEYPNIKGLIKELKMENDIVMLGWITDKQKFYQSIDIICIPSLTESFGLVILEGFIHGKSIIVSNVSGPLEIVTPDKDALIFPVGEFTELAKAIEQLVENPQLYRILTQNGFEKVKNYDLKVIIQNINECFQNIVAKK